MPIRINLKELFASDSQSITIDKLNFNFNKLLELGIGEIGEKGLTGPIGGAGPIGIDGIQGIRGATWYVDAVSNPNTIVFDNLLENDLYLDSNNLAIWQYINGQWVFVADITNIINNYLTSSPSPFIRGLDIGSPNDDRFILFGRRTDATDTIVEGTANNDILFLSNFDESLIDPDNFYNSLLSINIDHTTSQTGRYHFELGSLYDDGGTQKLSDFNENFKIRYLRNGSSLHTGLTYHNKALFSLDISETSVDSNRITNGVFHFQAPKRLATPSENTDVNLYFASKYGLDEEINILSGEVKLDGLLIQSEVPVSTFGGIGIAPGYNIYTPTVPYDNGYINTTSNDSYLMLDTYINSDGIIIDDTLYQDGGNIIQLGTSQPRRTITSPGGGGQSAPTGAEFFTGGAIAILGNELYTSFGNLNIYNTASADIQKYGYFNKFNISDPNNPVGVYRNPGTPKYDKFDGAVSTTIPSPAGCNSLYTDDFPIGVGLSDIAIDGDYIYAVNRQIAGITGGFPFSTTIGTETYQNVGFQILKKEGKNSIGLKRISYLQNSSVTPGVSYVELGGANRIELFGKYAIFTTNGLLNRPNPDDISLGALYTGLIGAIDIANPESPKFEVSEEPYKSLSAPSTCAILDMCIVDDIAYTLTWEQTDGGATTDYQIRVDSFDLSGLKSDDPSAAPSIQWLGRGNATIASGTGLNLAAISAITKFGSITSDGKYIYAGYEDTISRFKISTSATGGLTGFGVLPCSFSYPKQSDYTLSTSTTDVVKMKIVGNSLYVLSSNTSNRSNLYRLDVGNDQVEEIWNNSFKYSSSAFEIAGKHIYVALQGDSASDSNVPAIAHFDIDGIYSQGAHIESLRSDNINVIDSISIGNSLNLGGSLNVGSGANILGHLGVQKAIQTPYLINDEGSLTIKSIGGGITINSDGLLDIDSEGFNLSNPSGAFSISSTAGMSITTDGSFVITSNASQPNGAAILLPQSILNIDAWISPTQSDKLASSNAKDRAIFSHSYSNSSLTGVNQLTMNYTKIGSIIQVSGFIEFAGSGSGSAGEFDIPVLPSGGVSAQDLYGSGTAYYVNTMYPIEIKPISSNKWGVASTNGQVGNAGDEQDTIGGVNNIVYRGIGAEVFVRFNFSYTLR